MQEANLKGHQLENIVIRHIAELNKFSKENEEQFLEIIERQREVYFKGIDDAFQNFFDNIDSSQIIYNSENKLIRLKLKENELVIKNNFLDKNKAIFVDKNIKKHDEIFHHSKLNFGVFNKIRLNIFYCSVKDHINNDIKKLVMPIINKHKTENNDDFSLNDIFRTDENFSDLVFGKIYYNKYKLICLFI